MRRLVYVIVVILSTISWASAQRIRQFGRNTGFQTDVILGVLPYERHSAWLQTNWGFPLHHIWKDSIRLHGKAATGLNPEWNAPVAVVALENEQQLIVNRLINGYVHPFFGNANGGLLFVNNQGAFNLINNQNTFSLLGVNDGQWYTAALQRNKRMLWIGSDSGVRQIKLDGFITKRYPPSYYGSRKGIVQHAHAVNDSVVWLGTYGGEWLIAQDDTIRELKKEAMGLTEAWYIERLLTAPNGDTLLTANTQGRGAALRAYLIKNKTPLLISGGINGSVEHMAASGDGAVWMMASDRRLYRYRDGQLAGIETGLSQQTRVTGLATGPNNRKWISTIGRGVATVDDVSANIIATTDLKLCKGQRWTFKDSTTTIGKGIQQKIWQLDEQPPTAAGDSFQYTASIPGSHRLRLIATDANGSVGSDSITFEVLPEPYLSIKSKVAPSNCKTVTLDAYGWPAFRWQLPDGSIKDTLTIQALQEGRYKAVASRNGCELTDSVTIRYDRQGLELSIQLKDINNAIIPPNSQLTDMTPAVYYATISTPNDVCQGRWLLNGALIGDSSATPVNIEQTGSYNLRFEGINQDSCLRFAQFNFSIKLPQIPNLLTANGDGANEKLRFNTSAPVQLQLYNRWGKAVLSTETYRNDWPADDTPSGIYYYRLSIGRSQYTGWVQVVR